MSTRSCIALAIRTGFRSIYCHSDGTPGSVGRTLLTHYDRVQKVAALIRLGDLSVLGAELGEKHDFDWMYQVAADQRASDPRYRMCRAYGRDRGERGFGTMFYETFSGMVDTLDYCGTPWLYVWRNGAWWFAAVEPGLAIEEMGALTPQACDAHP
jgi:hypothetical protein